MSVQQTPLPKRRRRFWFLPRFSMRAFLFLVVLLAVSIAPLAQSTRRQMQVCERLKESLRIHVILDDPPTWLRFLPDVWLKLYGGHWCQQIKCVQIQNDFNVSPAQNRAKIKKAVALVVLLPHVEQLEIYDRDSKSSQAEILDCYSILGQIKGLRRIILQSQQSDLVLASLPQLLDVQSLSILGLSHLNRSSGLTDAGVQELRKFSRLQDLYMSGTQLAGHSLNAIACLKNIKEVVIYDAPRFITSDLECFANHPTLERFDSAPSYDDDAIRIFSTCSNLRSLNLSRAPITAVGLAYLPNIKNLEQLNLTSTPINDSVFSILSNCKSLKTLNCSHCKLTDAIGPTLLQLSNLESVDLRYTLTTEAILTDIAALKKISEFYHSDFPVNVDSVISLMAQQAQRNDSGWGNETWRTAYHHFGNDPQFPPSQNVTYLGLSELIGIRGRMNQVRDLISVTNVDLSETDIDDNDLQTLVTTCDIQTLNISRTPISSNGLDLLQQEANLSSLTTGPFENPDEALEKISSLPALTHLSIMGTDRLSESGLASIKKLQGLVWLDIDGCELDQSAVASLCELPQLDDLLWSNGKRLDRYHVERFRLQQAREKLGVPQGIESWSAATQNQVGKRKDSSQQLVLVDELELDCLTNVNLLSLDLKNIQLSQRGIDSLLRMKNLWSLDLSGTNVSDEMLEQIGELAGLESLDLSNTPITDACLYTLAQFKDLRFLYLANTRITDAGVSKIFQSRNLHTLDLSGTKVTLKAWEPINRDTPPVTYQLVLDNVPAASEILTKLPAKWLPRYIATVQKSTGISSEAVQSLRHERPLDEPREIEVSPTVLRAWPIEEILNGKSRLDGICINNTGRAAEIARTASQLCPKLTIFQFNHEHFDGSDSLSLPANLCTLQFKNCSISASILDSLTGCPSLREIIFESCDMADCSLEPLTRVRSLVHLQQRDTNLTAAQKQTWTRLNSVLEPLR